jgi:WD40 repeat protein
MIEQEKIEHVSSVSIIRWMTKEKTMIGASSLNDSQIYFYDTRHKFRPKCIFKGHSDVVKCFLYDPNEEYMVSASLVANSTNSNLVIQSLKNYINPY